ncbi:MAG: ribosome small subunit-dependent GTPase A [Bdellovibrio sp.]
MNFISKDAQTRVARVIFRSHGFVRLQRGEQISSGIFLKSTNPIVGDHVVVRDWEAVPWVIDEVLPRTSLLKRKDPGGGEQELAANVDWVWLVTSANQDLNPRRLERLLSLVWSSGAQPRLVITKADLCADRENMLSFLSGRFACVPVHLISSLAGEGLAELEATLSEGVTITMLGSSGVGKSTLTNRLLGREQQVTQGIRSDDDKGRHTTTSRELFVLPGGAFLIDQPGLREVHLVDGEAGIEKVFEDLARLEGECRFSDCRHQAEPGCAVLFAFENGDIDEDRWASYQKLQREAAFARAKDSKSLRLRQKERGKKIQKHLNQLNKERKNERGDW